MLSRRTFLKTVGVATVALAVGRLPDHFIGSALRAIALEATPIEDLGLQVRLANALKACDISTIGQLLSKRQDELLRLRSVGRFCLGHIAEMLIEKGFASQHYVDSKYPAALHVISEQSQFSRIGLQLMIRGTAP